MIADEIVRTATQVRIPGSGDLHRIGPAPTGRIGDRRVRTLCGETAPAHLAVLTTRDATCTQCWAVSRLGVRQRVRP